MVSLQPPTSFKFIIPEDRYLTSSVRPQPCKLDLMEKKRMISRLEIQEGVDIEA